jgi:hypothetical protein
MISTILLNIRILPNYDGIMHVMSSTTRQLEEMLHNERFEDAAELLEHISRSEVYRALYESEMPLLMQVCWEFLSLQPEVVN